MLPKTFNHPRAHEREITIKIWGIGGGRQWWWKSGKHVHWKERMTGWMRFGMKISFGWYFLHIYIVCVFWGSELATPCGIQFPSMVDTMSKIIGRPPTLRYFIHPNARCVEMVEMEITAKLETNGVQWLWKTTFQSLCSSISNSLWVMQLRIHLIVWCQLNLHITMDWRYWHVVKHKLPSNHILVVR